MTARLGFVAASPTTVRTWARAEGLSNAKSRGALSQKVIDAFNAAHKTGKGRSVYVADHVDPITVVGLNSQGKATARQTTNEALRDWATANGYEVGKRGRVSQDVLNAFVSA